jgi:glycosyltransferase involved in cell wall biosynthesis
MKKKLACWIVCRNEEYYIDMAIQSVLPYVDGIYIFDNGSDDNTIDVINSFHNPKIVLKQERYKTPYGDTEGDIPTRSHPYWRWDEKYWGYSLEAQTRNICMQECAHIFNPDWLIQLDADEVFTKRFFECLDELDLKVTTCLNHNTDRFVNHNHIARNLSLWPVDKYDPHVRSWHAQLPLQWLKPDKEMGHVVNRWPKGYSRDETYLYDIIHLHLHRVFGPKSVNFREGGSIEIDYHNIEVEFDWDKQLPFVADKWREWGGFDGD